MNLNTIIEVKRPKSFEEIEWSDGHAWLSGGTWLFSEPQVATNTLVDLERLGWPALTVTPAGLEIAATCKIVELHDFKGPPEWRAPGLRRLSTPSRGRVVRAAARERISVRTPHDDHVVEAPTLGARRGRRTVARGG